MYYCVRRIFPKSEYVNVLRLSNQCNLVLHQFYQVATHLTFSWELFDLYGYWIKASSSEVQTGNASTVALWKCPMQSFGANVQTQVTTPSV